MPRLLFIIILLMPALALASKESQFIKDVYGLSASIYDVKNVGNWAKGKKEGQVRLVITRSKKRDDIFLQWVSWDHKGPKKVESTIEVQEIRDMANFKLTYVRREKIEGKRQIVLGLENLYDKTPSKAMIQVTGVGEYRCYVE